jgi:hypothetical protein
MTAQAWLGIGCARSVVRNKTSSSIRDGEITNGKRRRIWHYDEVSRGCGWLDDDNVPLAMRKESARLTRDNPCTMQLGILEESIASLLE